MWNVGTGRATSFKALAETIAEGMEAKIEYIPMPEELKTQYQTYTCADLTKLKEALDEKDRS